MKSIRKVTAVTMAVVLAVSALLMSSCSTPAVAMTVDGKEYSTGEYLANLYMNFYSMYLENGLYQYASYGMDPWAQTFPTSDEEDAEELELADFLVHVTKEGMVRQKAIENLMAKYGITIPQEELDKVDEDLASAKESEMIAYGFSKENYKKAYIATNLSEQQLFYQLYDEGGQKEVPAADIRNFFDNEYVAFKSISILQMDDEGKALDEDKQAANRKTLEEYLDMFNKGKDIDAVIEQYEIDTTPTTTTTTGATTTTTTAATATTTAAETTTTVSESDATTTTTTAPKTEEESADEEETEEEEADEHLQLINTISSDKNLVEAVKKVPEKTAQIVEYTDENDSKYIMLVYRLNVEEEGGENYFEDQHDTILYGIKFDEFDEEVQGVVDSFEVKYNDRAIKMCDPKNFEKVMQKQG